MVNRSAWHNALALIVCGILLTTYTFTSWLAWQNKGITFDEPLHLVAAATQVRDGTFRFDQENPPLWKYYFALGAASANMALPPLPGADALNLPEAPTATNYATKTLYQTPGNDARALVNSGRMRMLPLAVALGALIAFWSFRLAGPLAACVACAAFSIDPNFLAHGLLIKNDVPITLLFTALMFLLWQTGRAATIANCCGLALVVAMALGTKFSGLLAIPILAVAFFVRAVLPAEWPVLGLTARTFAHRLVTSALISAVCLIISWIAVWACCDFRYEPANHPTADLDSAIRVYAAVKSAATHDAGLAAAPSETTQDVSHWQPDHLVRTVRWIGDHHLLPQAYLTGFIGTATDVTGRGSFLMGHTRLRGWWYYFPLAMAFKTPLATLTALVAATLMVFFLPRPRNLWTISCLSIAPIMYLLSAMHSGMNLERIIHYPLHPHENHSPSSFFVVSNF